MENIEASDLFNTSKDFHYEYLNEFKNSLKSVPLNTENIIKAIEDFKEHRLMSVDVKINMLTSFKRLNITLSDQALMFVRLELYCKFIKFAFNGRGVRRHINLSAFIKYHAYCIERKPVEELSPVVITYLEKMFMKIQETDLIDLELMKTLGMNPKTDLILKNNRELFYQFLENKESRTSLIIPFTGSKLDYLSIENYPGRNGKKLTSKRMNFCNILFARMIWSLPTSKITAYSDVDFNAYTYDFVANLLNVTPLVLREAFEKEPFLFKFAEINKQEFEKLKDMGYHVNKVMTNPDAITMLTNSTYVDNRQIISDEYVTNAFSNNWIKFSSYNKDVKSHLFLDTKPLPNSEFNYQALAKHLRPFELDTSKIVRAGRYGKKARKMEFKAPFNTAHSHAIRPEDLAEFKSKRMDISLASYAPSKAFTLYKDNTIKTDKKLTEEEKVNSVIKYNKLFASEGMKNKLVEIGQLEREAINPKTGEYEVDSCTNYKSSASVRYYTYLGMRLLDHDFQFGYKTYHINEDGKLCKLHTRVLKGKRTLESHVDQRWINVDRSTRIPVVTKSRVEVLESRLAESMTFDSDSYKPYYNVFTIASNTYSDAAKVLSTLLNGHYSDSDYRNIIARETRDLEKNLSNSYRYLAYEFNNSILNSDMMSLSNTIFPKETIAILSNETNLILKKLKVLVYKLGLRFIEDVKTPIKIDESHIVKYPTNRYTCGTEKSMNTTSFKDFDFTKCNTLYIGDLKRFEAVKHLLSDAIIDIDYEKQLVFLKLSRFETSGCLNYNDAKYLAKMNEIHKYTFSNYFNIADFILMSNHLRNILLLRPSNSNISYVNIHLKKLLAFQYTYETGAMTTIASKIANLPDDASIKVPLMADFISDRTEMKKLFFEDAKYLLKGDVDKINKNYDFFKQAFINRIIAETQHHNKIAKIESLNEIESKEVEDAYALTDMIRSTVIENEYGIFYDLGKHFNQNDEDNSLAGFIRLMGSKAKANRSKINSKFKDMTNNTRVKTHVFKLSNDLYSSLNAIRPKEIYSVFNKGILNSSISYAIENSKMQISKLIPFERQYRIWLNNSFKYNYGKMFTDFVEKFRYTNSTLCSSFASTFNLRLSPTNLNPNLFNFTLNENLYVTKKTKADINARLSYELYKEKIRNGLTSNEMDIDKLRERVFDHTRTQLTMKDPSSNVRLLVCE